MAETQGVAEQRSGWRTIRRVAPYLWPPGQFWAKWRVVAAMAALAGSILVGVSVPWFFKLATDALVGETARSPAWALAIGAIGLTLAYGLARLINVGLQQLRDAVFSRVGQRALRRLALETFTHIHALSLR
jgi:ATP-binding cassette, subfamily B, heavy metal transporter